MTPEIAQAELRMESGTPVAGLVARAEGLRRHMPRVIEIVTPLGADVLLFHSMNAREEMNRLFEYHVDLLSARDDINLDEILGKNVTIKLALAQDETRILQRLCDPFLAGRTLGRFRRYRARYGPGSGS